MRPLGITSTLIPSFYTTTFLISDFLLELSNIDAVLDLIVVLKKKNEYENFITVLIFYLSIFYMNNRTILIFKPNEARKYYEHICLCPINILTGILTEFRKTFVADNFKKIDLIAKQTHI